MTEQKDRQSSRLFRQNIAPEETADGHLSLSAYISRHLQARQLEDTEASARPAFQLPEGYRAFEQAPPGQRLNSLDVELTAGLEQYMPTPLFRLRVTKKRLDVEIEELRGRINKYQRLIDVRPAPDLERHIRLLRQRLAALELHEYQVNQELQQHLRHGNAFYRCLQRWQQFRAGCRERAAGWSKKVRAWFFGPDKLQIDGLNREILTLKELFEENMGSTATSAGEISQLIHQYEQAVRRLEQLTLRQTNRSGNPFARLFSSR